MLWMRKQLKDFEIFCGQTPIYCDNTSTINISENLVNHSRTKHMNVRHHFLRDNIAKGIVKLVFFATDARIADIFTKPLVEKHSAHSEENWEGVIFNKQAYMLVSGIINSLLNFSIYLFSLHVM